MKKRWTHPLLPRLQQRPRLVWQMLPLYERTEVPWLLAPAPAVLQAAAAAAAAAAAGQCALL